MADAGSGIEKLKVHCISSAASSVGDPEPDPQDPHVFGPPGSGSFPFLIKVFNGLNDWVQNKILTQNLSK